MGTGLQPYKVVGRIISTLQGWKVQVVDLVRFKTLFFKLHGHLENSVVLNISNTNSFVVASEACLAKVE